ncbi:FAD-dependent 5-carboxymethylaminomethyl-2-thiouridine(34) oxidoreductase MnmC [Rhodoferax sp.]|uniref:FAD-dependent 5-carboxymethylaminomethyl-2-thiouridine(34) oxidoreductase MnmC n=1 Tax=Rhodoferax sp. TaxID=50421 RepID=UPI0028450BCB|nr:FAD-dependent 5-carboxymethylaminomethyl-2-thiouridine(34) oxidoreductase MnmC [Rhodoferax sp.]MDR3369370.1 FAD-dependent 5-carboxymethylaminomethyl-2-thiouridine(34) oxidoreductase MnmC [Rhodoferax sp.]
MILPPAQLPGAGTVLGNPDAADWSGLPSWRILDTSFHNGQAFLRRWHTWLQDTRRPQMLHYVALCQHAPTRAELVPTCDGEAHLLDLASKLGEHWFGLLPGFHRFLLADGQVSLTLCVGDPMQSLRQQQFLADEVIFLPGDDTFPGAADHNELWVIKALARCCKRGARLHGHWPSNTPSSHWQDALRACGFVVSDDNEAAIGDACMELQAWYTPSWMLKTTRQTISMALPAQRCAVIGAGLAGASVAASLARRGWQVQVLDAADAPAAGASGLPVGLVVPHTSSDDCLLSRLSRAGVRLMLQQARQHLQEGTQWGSGGVLERQVGGTPQLPGNWPSEGLGWSAPHRNNPNGHDGEDPGPGLWHPCGAWIKPAALVQAWLNQPGVTFQGGAEVDHLQQDGELWHLHDASDKLLCSAERVVFANACGASRLLDTMAQHNADLAASLKQIPAMQGMRGLMSWALHDESAVASDAFAPFPVNGFSSMVPHIPTPQGAAWFMGATYQPDHHVERSDEENHHRNFEHLQELLPVLSAHLAPTFASNALHTWKGTRCITTDRLPLVGPLDDSDSPSLWSCAGLGSRGLSFSVLCAELLAARMNAEPLPVEARLAKALNALRG